jgi:3-oxoacid CoA-transferase subunit A
VEVEEIVEIGQIEPDQVHLPGIYVQRLVLNATPQKRIEHRTVRSA